MSQSIYSFKDYKDFLTHQIESLGRGARSKIAKAANCQLAYLSQIFSGPYELSLEQGLGISRFLQLNEMEQEYFIYLVLIARAGTTDLKKFLSNRANAIREEALKVSTQVKDAPLSEADQILYYSSWQYSAVHLITAISEYKTVEQIANRLQIPVQRTKKILDFLKDRNLVQIHNGSYTPKNNISHLTGQSNLISKHHGNWRLKAAAAAELGLTDNLQYSSCMTMSNEDAIKVKEILLEALKKSHDLVRKSNDEDIFGFNLDFFKL